MVKHGLSCLIYYRKRKTDEARLYPPNMKREVKILSNESVLHLHENNPVRKKRISLERSLYKARFLEKSNARFKHRAKVVPN